jgi:hypothetical protein
MTSKAHSLRLLTATAAAAALTITGAAHAAPSHHAGKKKPKPVCNLIKAAPKTSLPPSLQVIGGDVASNKTTVTVAIRVTKLTAWPDMGAPTGRDWAFQFVSGPLVTFEVMDGPFGTTSNIPGAHVTLDATRNEIRMSAAVSSVLKSWPTAQLTPGKGLFTGITARSHQSAEFPSQVATGLSQQGITYGDSVVAISPRSYLAGTPSCLKVGS